MDPTQGPLCPNCKLPVQPVWSYCPSCGTPLKETPLTVKTSKQIGIYLLSFFLPPFGLIPGIKYLKQKTPQAKTVGTVAIILTVISIIIMIIAYKMAMDYYQKLLESVTYPY